MEGVSRSEDGHNDSFHSLTTKNVIEKKNEKDVEKNWHYGTWETKNVNQVFGAKDKLIQKLKIKHYVIIQELWILANHLKLKAFMI